MLIPTKKILFESNIRRQKASCNVFSWEFSGFPPCAATWRSSAPAPSSQVARYGENYKLRRRVKPGITGLRQVSGRSENDCRQRVMLDMYCIMNWSLRMDDCIFLKTIFIVITRRRANMPRRAADRFRLNIRGKHKPF